MSDKCKWRDGKFEECGEFKAIFRETNDGAIFVSALMNISSNSLTAIYPNFCPYCGADIRKPEPLIDEREEMFDKWWNDNLGSQPPLIHPNDSPNMIAKKYCMIGFFGCYDLQDSQK